MMGHVVVVDPQRIELKYTDTFWERWNGARCPELVAGSGKQVEVVLMVAYDVQDVSTDRSRGRGAGHPITTLKKKGR